MVCTTAAINLATQITGTLGVTSGGTGTATQFTTGSVVFAGPSGVYTQDNSNFFWDNTNHRLGIGTTSPVRQLTVSNSSSTELVLQTTGAGANLKNGRIRTDSNGKLYIGKLSDDGNTGTDYVTLDNSTGNVGIGTTSPAAILDISSSQTGWTGGIVIHNTNSGQHFWRNST